MLKTVSSLVNTIGALNYKGAWNASTNSPALASGVGTKGDYYVVSTPGSTNLDGQTLWGTGDWAVFNGSIWQKVDGGSTGNFTTISASDTSLLATSSGNVGIGTASPNAKLHVYASGAIQAYFTSSDTNTSWIRFINTGYGGAYIGATDDYLQFLTSSSEKMRIPGAGGLVIGTAALATNATNGFLYVPTCAGTPTGTPVAQTGTAPIVIDTTNNKLYFYSGGQWRDAGP
jgi:hypothetical protein